MSTPTPSPSPVLLRTVAPNPRNALADRFYALLFDRHPLLRQHFPEDMDPVAAEVAPLFLAVAAALPTASLTPALESVLRWHLRFHPEPSCVHCVGDALFRTLETFCGANWPAVAALAQGALADITGRLLPELLAASTALTIPVWLPTYGTLEDTSLARLLHLIHLFRACGRVMLARGDTRLQFAFEDGQCGVYREQSHREKRSLMQCFGWPDGLFRMQLGALISEEGLRSFGEPAWVVFRGVTEKVPPYVAAGRIAPHMQRYAATRAHADQVLDRMARPEPLRSLCVACTGETTLEAALGANPTAEKILAAYYALETDLIITSSAGPMERPPIVDYAMVANPNDVGAESGLDLGLLTTTDESGPADPGSSSHGLTTRPPSSGLRRSASDLAIRRGREISSTRSTRTPEPVQRGAGLDMDADTDDTFRLEGSAAPLADSIPELPSTRQPSPLATSGDKRHSDKKRVERDTPGRGSPMAPSNDSIQARRAAAQRVRPEQAAARFFHRGWRLMEAGSYAEAAAEFDRAMAVDPGHARYAAWFAWAQFHADEGDAEDVIARLLRVPVSGAEAVDVHLVLGRIYKRRGERDKAIAEFTMASVVSPDCPEALREIRRYENARSGTDHNSWSDDRPD